MKKEKYQVSGMTCAACSLAVEKQVKKIDGISDIHVNLLQNNMTVTYDESKANPDTIMKAVADAGYGASPQDKSKNESQSSENDPAEAAYQIMRRRFIWSFVFTFPLFYISMGHMYQWPMPGFLLGHANALNFAFTQFLLTVPVAIINHSYYLNGFKTLWKRSPNMDSLIAVGTGAAILYGIFAIFRIGTGLGHQNMELVMAYSHDLYFESSGVILTLITLGKFLEARAKGSTSEAIKKLMDLSPKTALVERDGLEITIPVEALVAGDFVLVKPGQRVPADGLVMDGYTSVDEAMITGESIPVEKKAGNKVTAGSINKTGFIKFKAEKVGEDTTLSQIIRLVEEAQATKAPIAKMADKISGVFVPVVLAISLVSTIVWLLLGYSFEFALSIGIAVLVISCPCALGLATPTAIMVGTGKGAENGILIKSGEALEVGHKVQTIVLDKTGTITVGQPEVKDILSFNHTSEASILRLSASLEKGSEHPLAEAVIQKAESESLDFYPVESFNAIPGKGITGSIEGRTYHLGNLKLMRENGIEVDPHTQLHNRLSNEGKTLLYLADDQLLGILTAADVVKDTSVEAIQTFKKMGLDVVMLTGDNQLTGEAIGRQVGVDHVIAEVMPAEKEQAIRSLQGQGKVVAMVGDGINDAPALARADIGIAIGAGTDVAMESADMVLMRSDLMDVASAIQLSKATIRNIKQNLFWAFFYNSAGIPLAAGLFYSVLGWKLSPMFAAAAMSLSSVSVVANALRLKGFKPIHAKIKPNQPIHTKGDDEMKREIIIEGMTCNHCKMRVEKTLRETDGVVSADVILDEKKAVVVLDQDLSDQHLTDLIHDAGYKVIEIK